VPRFPAEGSSRVSGTDVVAQAVVEEVPSASDYDRNVHAADLAFKAGGSALVVVDVRVDGTIDTLDALELKPTKKRALLPSAVIRDFAAVLRKHGVTEVLADSHARESAREEFAKHGVTLRDAPNSSSSNTEAHATTRGLFLEGLIKIGARETTLTRQLKEITARPLERGLIKFSAPRRRNEHGDVASAFVLAVSQAFTRRALSDADCHIFGGGERVLFGQLTGRSRPRDKHEGYRLDDGGIDWDAYDEAQDALSNGQACASQGHPEVRGGDRRG
jgi:hypothetical protein